jgi:SSS family solute:Na+ symporter
LVSGLFIPVLGVLFWKKSHPIAVLLEYACWRSNHNLLIITENKLPLGVKLPEHLDANIYGISISLLLFVTISTYHNNKKETQNGIQNN